MKKEKEKKREQKIKRKHAAKQESEETPFGASENSLEEFARDAIGSEDSGGLFSEEEKDYKKPSSERAQCIEKREKPKKRRGYEDDGDEEDEALNERQHVRRFLEEMADVDEDEGEDDYQVDDLEEEELPPQEAEKIFQQQLKRTHYHLTQQSMQAREINNEQLREIAMDYEKRVENVPKLDPQKNPVLQKSVLPTIGDAKLWLIKLRKPGLEKVTVIALLNKAIALAQTSSNRVSILSATAIDNLPGFIYIEAFKESHIKAAVEGMANISRKPPKMVPITEMAEIFEGAKSSIINLEEGMWVRPKSGMYANDLGRVEYVQENLVNVMVKLVPRFEPILEMAGTEGRELTEREKQKLKLQRASRYRPPQHHFMPNPSSAAVIEKQSHDGKYYTYWNNFTLKEGFLYRRMKAKSLIVEGVQPQPNELQLFQRKVKLATSAQDAIPEEEEIQPASQEELQEKPIAEFYKDDKVEIIKGALAGLEGTVVSVGKQKIIFQPSVDEIPNLQVPFEELSKVFQEGDFVQVIARGSEYLGESGLVTTAWEDQTVTFYSSRLKKEVRTIDMQLKVNVNELSSCNTAELAFQSSLRGKSSLLDDINRFDLVQLTDSQMCGVILKFNNHTVTVLTNKNEVEMIEVGQINHKIISLKNSGMDCRNNAVVKNDKVRVMTGEAKNVTGTVLHIKGNRAFIRIMDKIQEKTQGIRCELLRNLLLIGSDDLGDGNVMKNASLLSGPLRFNKDPKIGKRVTITGGDWKLNKGVVIDANDLGYRVELASRNKIVTVQKEYVEEVQDFLETGIKRELKREPREERGDYGMGIGTPAYGMMNTPNSPGWGGGQTPAAFSEIDPSSMKSPGQNY